FSDAIEGVTMDLMETGSVTLEVGADKAGLTEKIKAFTDAYNKTVSNIKSLISKDGAMQGNSTLRDLSYSLSNMALFAKDGRSAVQFGIEVDKGASAKNLTGAISIDTDQILKMLESDPEETAKFMSAFMTNASEQVSNFTSSVHGRLTQAIAGFDSMIKVHDEKMERMSMQLDMREQRLINQFNTMETLMNSLKSEQQWLTQQ